MTVRTNHIRQMLDQAHLACEKAEKLSKLATTAPDLDVERLLEGAIINADHAAAEIRDELFRHHHGLDGYTR